MNDRGKGMHVCSSLTGVLLHLLHFPLTRSMPSTFQQDVEHEVLPLLQMLYMP